MGYRNQHQVDCVAGTREEMLVSGLQPGGHQADRLGQRRRQGQALVDQHVPQRGQPRGQGQRLLCQVQPQLLLPPGLWFSRSLCSLLRPQIHQAASKCVQGPQKSCVLCQVPQQRGHCLSLDRFSAETVEREPEPLRQILHWTCQ